MSDYLDPNNEELLKDFFSEAFMQVEVMEQNILALEDDPGDQDAIDEIFRAAHTLKGSAAAVQMNELSSFTRLLEDLLDEIHSGKVRVVEENVDILLLSIDVIKAMVASRQNGDVYEEDYSAVSANLELMIAGRGEIEPEPESAPEPVVKRETSSGSILQVDSRRIDNLLNLVSESVINKATFNWISTQFTEILRNLATAETAYKDSLKGLFDSMPDWLSEIREGRSLKEIKTGINEKTGGLFSIFDDVESQLKGTVGAFRKTAANLGRNTGDLHEAILKIRMVPINQIFSRFPRLGKRIDMIIEGEDTELDKSVTEELLDPLMHCVRNSMDHGIESPEVRKNAGKPVEGRLLLKASNERNTIIIEIADDGAGIDIERVREKAIDRGIIHPDKALSEVETFDLIFEPGFSTTGEVTDISGLGVGFDVVRKQIEKLNGSVTVWSKLGEGTRFTIKLPLTLPIIQGLLVRVGTEIYALPIASVLESHRITPEEINIIDNYEVFNVREDVVSILRLGKLFRIDVKDDSEYNFIVIVGSGDKKMGLMVDALIGEEDVVIKPLKDRYTNSPGIAGATILGDGTVSLIIDVGQLLDLSARKDQEAGQNRAAG